MWRDNRNPGEALLDLLANQVQLFCSNYNIHHREFLRQIQNFSQAVGSPGLDEFVRRTEERLVTFSFPDGRHKVLFKRDLPASVQAAIEEDDWGDDD